MIYAGGAYEQVSNTDGSAIKALLQSGQVNASFLSQEILTHPGTIQGDLACFVREGTDYCVSIYRSAAPRASPDWVFVYNASTTTIFTSFEQRAAFQGSYFQTDIAPHERGDVTTSSQEAQKVASWGSLWTFDNTVFAESNAGGGIWTLDLTADEIFDEIGLNSPQGALSISTLRIPVAYVGPADPDKNYNDPTDYWQDGFNCVNASSPWLLCPEGMAADRNRSVCVCPAGYSGPDDGPCNGIWSTCMLVYTRA